LKKVYRSYAKVNIFLKIVGAREEYHEIVSRFVLLDKLYDTMWFEPNVGMTFDIIGDFECERKDNTIYKAYQAILDYIPQKRIVEFCKHHKLVVFKKIPKFAGLGGGSSNAATFIKMVNEMFTLGLSVEEMAKIGFKVGADVPFFAYGYKSANVSGIGEVVEEFKDEIPEIKLLVPEGARCDTKEIYKIYRRLFMSENEPEFAKKLIDKTSKEILEKYEPEKLNDLFKAVLKKYPEYHEYKRDEWFLSGSGSALFKTK